MEYDRTLAIVVGHHECSYPPPQAYDAGLKVRFAAVFHTYRSQEVGVFDADLFVGILQAICQAVAHDSLTIEMDTDEKLYSLDDLSMWYRIRAEDARDPPIRVYLVRGNRMVAYAETEPWALVGGPFPYHDSYTLAFYTADDRTHEFQCICERISKEMGANIIGVHKGLASKEPFTPLWMRPLRWLGAKPW